MGSSESKAPTGSASVEKMERTTSTSTESIGRAGRGARLNDAAGYAAPSAVVPSAVSTCISPMPSATQCEKRATSICCAPSSRGRTACTSHHGAELPWPLISGAFDTTSRNPSRSASRSTACTIRCFLMSTSRGAHRPDWGTEASVSKESSRAASSSSSAASGGSSSKKSAPLITSGVPFSREKLPRAISWSYSDILRPARELVAPIWRSDSDGRRSGVGQSGRAGPAR
mmetsp:Transcript_35634/g.83158  ORF Transcript_35634/g.83158 Transcript_35634/m.83158 type:complete len:229 (+) Transcript_35634:131-817(+)